MGIQNPSPPPKSGLGRSDGGKGILKDFQGNDTTTGTFKNYKNYCADRTVKFDKGKRLVSSETAVAVAA